MLELLDELSADPKPAPKAEPNPAQDPAPAKAETPPAADPADPKNPEQEEAELLEGVKSERGKERIRQVFAERKQLETDITEFRELVKSTGMSAQEFATTLEFGRLINSGDEKNIRVALEMIEGQRAMLYQKLGVEAPGVDLLDGQDDLKAAVENMEITRERAVELAKYRKTEAVKAAQVQQEQQATQGREQYQQTVSAASQQMEAYLETRKNEVDHTARMKVISDHFRKPENVQAFVQTYQPNQWMATIKMMYDGIVVPKAAPAPSPQPLRSRPATLGTPTASAASPMDRLAQHIDNLGI
jgi:type III secretory pathway component EscV